MKSTPTQRQSDRFHVAFSFAGEQRELVLQIAEAVEQRLGWGSVFIDEWFGGVLAQAESERELRRQYMEKAEIVVVCLSEAYGEKEWPRFELGVIHQLFGRLRDDLDERAVRRILALRVGDGLVHTDIGFWLDARKYTVKFIADSIVLRLAEFLPQITKPHVFLAETTPDLEVEDNLGNRQRLLEYLKAECHVEVLPETSLIHSQPNSYASALDADLRKSHAFVQLLSPCPWRGGGFDRAQYAAAERAGCEMFRFRGDIDLEQVAAADPDHRRFLEANGSINGSIIEFGPYLCEKLKTILQKTRQKIAKWQKLERLARYGAGAVEAIEKRKQPLVRVAIRAGDAERVWDPIFKFLHLHENIRLDELQADESFVDLHETEQCHGFLILCDGETCQNDKLALVKPLRQCTLIHMQLKESTYIPPVAVVYWPPPKDANWSALIKCIPQSLHQIDGTQLKTALKKFLVEVRRVRSALP